MFNQIIKYSVQPDQVDAFKDALLRNKQVADAAQACAEYRLFVDNQEATLFFVYARWDSKKSCEAFSESRVDALSSLALQAPAEVLDLGETNPLPDHDSKELRPGDDVFIIFFIFKFKEEMRQQLLDRFEEHVSESRKEDGCILFDLFTIDGVDDQLVVYEHWRNESAVWDIHFKQPHSEITGALMHKAVIGDMKQYMNFVSEVA